MILTLGASADKSSHLSLHFFLLLLPFPLPPFAGAFLAGALAGFLLSSSSSSSSSSSLSAAFAFLAAGLGVGAGAGAGVGAGAGAGA